MPLYHNPLVIQPLVRLSEMKAYCSENVFLLQEGEKLFELDQVENVSFDKDVFSIHGHVYDMTINYTVDVCTEYRVLLVCCILINSFTD